MTDQKMMIRQVMNGDTWADRLSMYRKLLVEANTQL